jgi:hypothetical protein
MELNQEQQSRWLRIALELLLALNIGMATVSEKNSLSIPVRVEASAFYGERSSLTRA